MVPFKFRRQATGNPDLDRVQSHVSEALDPVLDNVLLRGRLIDIEMGGNQIEVEHKLNREPRGWFVMTNNAPMTLLGGLYEDRTLSLDRRDRVIVLRWAGFTVPVTFSLWVF